MVNMKACSNVMKVTFYGDADVMNELQKQAEALGLSRNAYMSLILGAFCGDEAVLHMANSLLKTWDRSPIKEYTNP